MSARKFMNQLIMADALANYGGGGGEETPRPGVEENRESLAAYLEARRARKRANQTGRVDLAALRRGEPAGRQGWGDAA